MNPLQRVAMLQQQKQAYASRFASAVNFNQIMKAVEKHLKSDHKGLEGWGDWHGDGTLFQCNNESKGLELALEVKAKKDGMQADIQITDDEGDTVVETAQIIHADMTNEASIIKGIHQFMVEQAKHAVGHKKHAAIDLRSALKGLLIEVTEKLEVAEKALQDANVSAYELGEYVADPNASTLSTEIVTALNMVKKALHTSQAVVSKGRFASSSSERVASLEATVASLEARLGLSRRGF